MNLIIKFFAICGVAIALFYCDAVNAQSLVLNGWYGCQRATNGRAYCKRQGSDTYHPVPEDFFLRYEAARTGAASPAVTSTVATRQTNVIQASTNISQNIVVLNLKNEASDLKGQIALLDKIFAEQQEIKKKGKDVPSVDQTLRVIELRLKELRSHFHDKTVALHGYVTSIKPDDADLKITARKESEIYTKIPYYISGTKETGEFWVEPVVTDSGTLIFKFQFVDVESRAANKIRATIDMLPSELERTMAAMLKASKNSALAHEKKITRKLDVRLDCFPDKDCPAEGSKVPNKSSTEILFSINDDGSTGVRIQRNKGIYQEAYNVSIGSALLLQAYINHVLKTGTTEYEMGKKSTEDLKAMFR